MTYQLWVTKDNQDPLFIASNSNPDRLKGYYQDRSKWIHPSISEISIHDERGQKDVIYKRNSH